MVKYRIIGNRGSFITSRKDTKKYYKKGDFTNTTGNIKKIVLVKRRRK